MPITNKNQIKRLANIIDHIEDVQVEMDMFYTDTPRADSFVCGADGKLNMAIDELREAINAINEAKVSDE